MPGQAEERTDQWDESLSTAKGRGEPGHRVCVESGPALELEYLALSTRR
jgi:hypothetical protein